MNSLDGSKAAWNSLALDLQLVNMKRLNFVVILAITFLCNCSGNASAGLLMRSDGSAGFISARTGNDLIFPLWVGGLIDPVNGGQVAGFFGSNINFSGLNPSDRLRFTFFGEEAGFTNSFQVQSAKGSAWTELFQNQSGNQRTFSPGGIQSFEFQMNELVVSNGLFRFGIDLSSLDPLDVDSGFTNVVNGFNADDLNGGADQNFFVSEVNNKVDRSGTARTGLLLWLDDGGANNDDDFDDMVVFVEAFSSGVPVRIAAGPPPQITAAPEPASFAIWSLIGLSACGVRRRRR